ncbi:DUF4222 domain-containing protein [Escherichia coli]|nr:DUF4222 domain-containing protein [Escherichia coli]
MFRIIFPNTWYVDHHGTPCKILRSTHNKVHYIRKGRTEPPRESWRLNSLRKR